MRFLKDEVYLFEFLEAELVLCHRFNDLINNIDKQVLHFLVIVKSLTCKKTRRSYLISIKSHSTVCSLPIHSMFLLMFLKFASISDKDLEYHCCNRTENIEEELTFASCCSCQVFDKPNICDLSPSLTGTSSLSGCKRNLCPSSGRHFHPRPPRYKSNSS